MHSNETVAAQSPTGTRRDKRQVKALTQERSASYLRKIPVGKKKGRETQGKNKLKETHSHIKKTSLQTVLKKKIRNSLSVLQHQFKS